MRRPRASGVWILIALFGLFTQLHASSGRQAQETFRSGIEMVSIQATVRDGRGRTVPGLTAADFEVLDNGQARPIIDLQSDTESPLSVAVLADTSGSMRDPVKIATARRAFDSVLVQLRGGHDEAAVFTFDSSLHERARFTSDMEQLKRALLDFQPFGNTSLYDATAETAQRLTGRPSRHRAVIVLTDGVDTSSRLTAAEVSALAAGIDVPVYVVATVADLDYRQMLEGFERPAAPGSADLRDLADWTGGRLVFATTFKEAVSLATAIVQELRQQYVLAIEATPEREWRRLQIRVRRPSATVQSRSGYFGG